MERSTGAQACLKLARKKLNAGQLVEESDTLLIHSPYTPKALMSSTGEAWEEGAPHTLGCFGVVRPITGWCDTVFGVHLFTRYNAHTHLL